MNGNLISGELYHVLSSSVIVITVGYYVFNKKNNLIFKSQNIGFIVMYIEPFCLENHPNLNNLNLIRVLYKNKIVFISCKYENLFIF